MTHSHHRRPGADNSGLVICSTPRPVAVNKNARSSVPVSIPSSMQLAMSTPSKSSLTITLTEPLVILRTVDIAGAQSLPGGVAPPSVVRGLLALDLSKASRISCIQVELQATSFSSWSEGLSYAHSLLL